jgi:SpoIID/LytB domain protein
MSVLPVEKFLTDQLSVWPLAAGHFRALKSAKVKTYQVGGIPVKAQCNPARIQSSLAGDPDEVFTPEGCFLCKEYRPPEQGHLRFEGRKGRLYRIQVNPYPIFPNHLVIARDRHVDQSIWRCFVDALDLSRELRGYTIFYNGPKSGASKPDHMHFQACPSGLMPLETAVEQDLKAKKDALRHLTDVQDARLFHYGKFTRGVFLLRAQTAKSAAKLFYRLLDCAPILPGEKEPRFNLLTWYASGEYRTLVIFRSELRSHHFYAEGDEHFTMSIGCADIAGFFICPVEAEFERLDASVLQQMLGEVSVSDEVEDRIIRRLTRTQRTLDVGIMSAKEIRFEIISDGAGTQVVKYAAGRIDYNGMLYDELVFDAVTPSSLFAEPSFILHDVTIGVDFHWERKLDQKFAGSLRFIVEGDKVVAVNRVGVEDYLLSVISSEMKGSASEEFLKAHAVISRSWVMAQIGRRKEGKDVIPGADRESEMPGQAGHDNHPGHDIHAVPDGGEYIRWFDHDDHTLFDVCADDHCQRYQGLGGSVSKNARRAVDATWGEVLTSGGTLCDARFSKCCGGVMERFSTCWEDRDFPYLQVKPDTPETGGDPFCDTADEAILGQVLNDYDLETKDFYRWTVRRSRAEWSELVRNRSGVDFGEIKAFVPVERGGSGRICRLRIEGTRRTMTVGKELMIRRWLSDSHLKSSAFEVEYDGDDIVLHGRGWGHGVGLCQIGAAVMASRGYTYQQILAHYYPGSILERL